VRILEIGKVYNPRELTVSLEFNLEDLYWLQSLVPWEDGFRKDLQGCIDAIEKRMRVLSEQEGYGLSMVVMEVPR